MRATGVVRRIDDLGRIVIPKEIRRTMHMREGDPLEIFVENNGEIVLKKYSLMDGLADFSQVYADALYKCGGMPCAVCDTDKIVAVAGTDKESVGLPVTREIEEIMQERRTVFRRFTGEKAIYPHSNSLSQVNGVVPLISNGDCEGAVMLLSQDNLPLPDVSKKLLSFTAAIMSANLEE